MENKIKYTLITVILVLFLFGCAGQNQSDLSSQGQPNKTANITAVKEHLVELNVTAKQWEFIPNTIKVKQGDHVKLYLTSIDVVHGFLLSDYYINVKIEPGKISTVDFIANKSGEFEFRCSVMCGEGHMNQRGKLIVEPA